MHHVGPYSKNDPPAVDDVVMVLFTGPRVVGKVTQVDTDANECTIRILDGRAFDLYSKMQETGKMRTVSLGNVYQHPRMHSLQHPAQTPMPEQP